MTDPAAPPPPSDPARQPPVVLRDGQRIVDIDRYAPFFLSTVGNAWQRRTAAIYRARFDLGVQDWRVLSMIQIAPRITATGICEGIRLDKGAVSRSLKLLHTRGLLDCETPARDERKRLWWLTPAGVTLHDAILDIALTHESAMVRDVTPAEMELFLSVMRRFLANLER